jgi:hypothetical protein
MSARPAFGNEGEGQPLAQGAQADTEELWNQRSDPVRERSEVGDQVCVPEAGQLGQGGPRFGEWLRAHRLPDPFRFVHLTRRGHEPVPRLAGGAAAADLERVAPALASA